eukprot:2465402-Amphidinium_carterae.1
MKRVQALDDEEVSDVVEETKVYLLALAKEKMDELKTKRTESLEKAIGEAMSDLSKTLGIQGKAADQ